MATRRVLCAHELDNGSFFFFLTSAFSLIQFSYIFANDFASDSRGGGQL